jgi:2-methylcitrate dehydratase PrpD
VGFAVDAGIRAARLAAAGATADVGAVGQWLALVGGDPARLRLDGPAVPGGLAVKLFPCCYALQRPIDALAGRRLPADTVTCIALRTPRSAVMPLIHHDPVTGLESKFSIEYAAAATLLDGYPGLASFTDEAVRRPEARRLVKLVELSLSEGGDGLLAGDLEAEVYAGDEVYRTRSRRPPGSPERPPEPSDLRRKIEDCLSGTAVDPDDIAWPSAADVLRSQL